MKIFRVKIDWNCNFVGLNFEFRIWISNIPRYFSFAFYTIPFCFSLIWHFLGYIFQLVGYFFWLRISDESSLPEMRIWSISLIISVFKLCIHQGRSLFSYHISTTMYLMSVTSGGPGSRWKHMYPSSTVGFDDSKLFEITTIFCVKMYWNWNFVGLLYHPYLLKLVSGILVLLFNF